jgi:phenylacetate-CoA ligase
VIRLERALIFALIQVATWVRKALLATPRAERLLRPGFEPLLWRIGTWRLWLAVEQARKHVPAYRTLLSEHGDPQVRLRGLVPDFSAIPVTDKENYVLRFSTEERCRHGRIPPRGVVIDESSGTSGSPNNWVRGPEERADVQKLLQLDLRQVFGQEPLFLVNAFALGPWATGMAVSMGTVDVAILKSVGPDVGKIEATLRQFGPRYPYLVLGYPPFLKRVVDEIRIDWSAYDCAAVVGGEGMSEALRSYLLRRFRAVYSSFGAADLEINVAAENDFTIALRRLLAERPELRHALGLSSHASLPMVFQYNPLDYVVETNESGELVISICRAETAAPKLRYNLHDLGSVVRFPEVKRSLATLGLRPADLAERHLDLPLLFHYGRSDSTVAFYGANVAPEDVQEVVYSLPELAERVGSFALLLGEDEETNETLAFAFELAAGAGPPEDVAATRTRVLDRLAEVNQDYREVARFIPQGREPTLEFHAPSQGPFAGYDVRLKRKYVHAPTTGGLSRRICSAELADDVEHVAP